MQIYIFIVEFIDFMQFLMKHKLKQNVETFQLFPFGKENTDDYDSFYITFLGTKTLS